MVYYSSSERNVLYNKMLLIVLWRGGYPHQVLSFLYNKCITYPEDSREDRTNAFAGKCQGIVTNKSGISLEGLAGEIQTAYAKTEIDASVLESIFEVFNLKMALSVAEYVVHFAPQDKTALIRYESIRDVAIKDTLLKNYFGTRPAHNIADWCHKVKQRVEEQLNGSKANPGWYYRSYDDFLDSIVEERAILIEKFPHCATRYYRMYGTSYHQEGIVNET